MSSSYNILCLSHDPAIIVEPEYRTPGEAETALRQGVDFEVPIGHPNCDLMIGRWSGSLIEVGCPPGQRRPGQRCCTHHSTTEWVGVAWLRILAAVHHYGDVRTKALTGDSHLRHWHPERLCRLRHLLGIDLTEEQP